MSVVAHKVNNKVQILYSQHTPDWLGLEDVVISPVLPYDVPVKYLDIVNGEVVEVDEQTKIEIDAAIQAEIDRQLLLGDEV